MGYKEFIQDILDTRGRFGISKDEYKERHHIIPKCLGGSNEEYNLIDLYAQEHYIAHQMLSEENPSCNALSYALWNMANMQGSSGKRYKLTAKEYEEVRKNVLQRFKSENNPMFGKQGAMFGKHHSEETKEKIRQKAIGRKMPKEVKDAESLYWKGKRTGKNNPMFGKKGGKHPLAKPVYQFSLEGEFIKAWESAKDAESKLGICASNITNCCNKKKYNKTAGGFIWSYNKEGA